MFENYSKCRILIFQFWHFPPIFVLLKVTCLVTLFDRKLQNETFLWFSNTVLCSGKSNLHLHCIFRATQSSFDIGLTSESDFKGRPAFKSHLLNNRWFTATTIGLVHGRKSSRIESCQFDPKSILAVPIKARGF